MALTAPPDGFGWVWAGDTVRINLPRFVVTASHAYEPVLSRRDAERVADAVVSHDRARRATTREVLLARILLAHDPRYASSTLSGFRAKLSIALIERGRTVSIDEMVTMSGLESETDT